MSFRDAWSKFGALQRWMVPALVAEINYTTGTPAVTSQKGNQITLTDTGSGDIRCTFAEAMPDANYVVQATPTNGGDSKATIEDKTTTTFDIQMKTDDGTSGIGVAADVDVDVVVFMAT
jgi:hypothetical protein